jgi:hypothetical protein
MWGAHRHVSRPLTPPLTGSAWAAISGGSVLAIRMILVGVWVGTLLANTSLADPCTSTDACRDQFAISTGKTIAYYRSFPLVHNDAIERVVIVVHGNQRDADAYYDRLVSAASAEDRLADTLLLAPNFRTVDDVPAANEHYWSSGGWKRGDKSRDDPGRFSSFAVMNELVAEACSTSTFPELRSLVVIGHSAGGQFVNRYAAGGTGCPDPAVETRYIVMNPSSYLYLDDLRRSLAGDFEVPSDCTVYDEYKYGLVDLNSYMTKVGTAQIRSDLFERQTYYLVGEEDTSTGGNLDTTCPGNSQGRNRHERHDNYRRHADRFDEWTGSTFLSVPGVGHSGTGMMMSEMVRRLTFGDQAEAEPATSPEPPTLLNAGVRVP